MNAPLRRPWTQEEFFDWADGQEGRWEFDGFQPVDMNAGTLGHATVIGNLNFVLRTHLRATPCQALGPGAGVATIGQAVRYPDVVVTCDRLDMATRVVPNPIVLFEVLSPTTSRTDRIDKVREYAAIASVRRYVILESTSSDLTVFKRTDSGEPWRATTLGRDDVLRMPEIGIEVPVAELYQGLAFAPV